MIDGATKGILKTFKIDVRLRVYLNLTSIVNLMEIQCFGNESLMKIENFAE
jgi:hypothetical protein